MKKIRNLTMVITALSILGLTSPTIAKDYKIGDSMPDYKKNSSSQGGMMNLTGPKECKISVQLYYEENGTQKYTVAFPGFVTFNTLKRPLPYGIFDKKKKILYLDNKLRDRSKGSDGIIDEIDQNPGRKRTIFEDSPGC